MATEEKANLMQQLELSRELDEAKAGKDAIQVVPKGTRPQGVIACFGGILPAELNQDQDAVQAFELLGEKIASIAEARKAEQKGAAALKLWRQKTTQMPTSRKPALSKTTSRQFKGTSRRPCSRPWR